MSGQVQFGFGLPAEHVARRLRDLADEVERGDVLVPRMTEALVKRVDEFERINLLVVMHRKVAP